jgi:hypothetical protein
MSRAPIHVDVNRIRSHKGTRLEGLIIKARLLIPLGTLERAPTTNFRNNLRTYFGVPSTTQAKPGHRTPKRRGRRFDHGLCRSVVRSWIQRTDIGGTLNMTRGQSGFRSFPDAASLLPLLQPFGGPCRGNRVARPGGWRTQGRRQIHRRPSLIRSLILRFSFPGGFRTLRDAFI